jgi:4-amino-4-deoxy-L-arabinose transferase-like glycosyltransferase
LALERASRTADLASLTVSTEIGQGLRATRGPGLLLWLALAAVWFATVQVRPLLDPDEGRYAEIPREMVASGDWITPRFNDLKYFEKPALQYWATAAVYSVFGLSEWSARLWTVGLAFLCLPMVYGWTARLYGPQAGLAALAALATSPFFGIVGHLNLLDAGFTFWLTGAVFAFCLAQSAPMGSPTERRWMLVTWLAAALAVLSKGIVVGVLAGLTLILYTIVERDPRPWQRLHLGLGLPLFLLVAVPWFIAVTVRNPEFPGFFFVHEHFARFLTTVHKRVEPWWFFLPLVFFGVLPWLPAVVSACRRAWRDAGPTAQFKPLKFLLIFAVVTLVFFSASGSKLVPYVLPMLPPLAAIVGVHVAERPQFIRRAAQISAALMAFLGIGLLIYTQRRSGFIVPAAITWSAIGVAAGIVALFVTWKTQPASTLRNVLVTAAASILGWQCLLAAYTVLPPQRSAYGLVSAAKAFIRPDTPLYSVGQYRETVSPYLQRTMTLVAFQGELEFGLQQEPGKQLSLDDFISRWRASQDAVAFVDPHVFDSLRQRGLPGRVIASDNYTVAVSRQ